MKPAHSTLPLVRGPGDAREVGKEVIGDGCRGLEVTGMYFVKLKLLPVTGKGRRKGKVTEANAQIQDEQQI